MLFIGASFRWDGIGCEGQLSSGPEQIALTLYYHLCVDLASLARVLSGLRMWISQSKTAGPELPVKP